MLTRYLSGVSFDHSYFPGSSCFGGLLHLSGLVLWMREADGMVLGLFFEPCFNNELICVLAHNPTLTSKLGKILSLND